MKLYKVADVIIVEKNEQVYQLNNIDWDTLINTKDLSGYLNRVINNITALTDGLSSLNSELQTPIGTQEVWAAGVTYLRSKVARMEESEKSGGATFYDKVYDADRPELFFKANAQRVMGNGQKVRIRKDSTWNVPEPELVLVVNSVGNIVGYTIGNDMSSRSIEGENPLYLPQAKVYDGSAAIGPCVLVKEEEPIPSTTTITIQIKRAGAVIYSGETTIDQMKRKHEELVDFLYRECSFPQGAYLMTGTCLVPDDDFTLQSNDEIAINIEGIGTLNNVVA